MDVDNKIYYISALWYNKFLTLSNPGPISNLDFMCVHHGIKADKELKSKVVPIPFEVWITLHTKYGGGPEVTVLDVCKECEEALAKLNERKKREHDTINKIDIKRLDIGEYWYLIDTYWLRKWQAYLNSSDSNEPHPGPISNHSLLKKDGTPKLYLQKLDHYKGAHPQVWNYLFSIYGGGPPIIRNVIDIYAAPVILQKDDQESTEHNGITEKNNGNQSNSSNLSPQTSNTNIAQV